MSRESLHIGIIGAGVYAVFAHIPQLRAIEQVEITAVSRRNPERLTMVKDAFKIPNAYTDWREMLVQEPLDAVVVSTPHHLHYEPTMAALSHGLHVLVEKPMALKSVEAWEMVSAAKQAQRVLMVGYPDRLKGIWRTVKQLISSDGIGRLRQINLAVSFYRRWFWDGSGAPADFEAIVDQISTATGLPPEFFAGWGQTWHHDPEQMGGGALVDLGPHYIDRMLWLADAPAVEVMAMADRADMPVECFVNVQARSANDVLFTMTSADAVPQSIVGGQQQLMIVGETGVLTNDAEGGIWLYRDGERTLLESEFDDRTEAEVFVNAIRTGDTGYPQAHEGAYTVDFLEALYRSAAERQIVRLRDV